MIGCKMESSDKKPKWKEDTEYLRIGASISFAVIILLIGIPLWWKTTEVYRVVLPNDKINSFKNLNHKIFVNISYCLIDGSDKTIIDELKRAETYINMFNVSLNRYDFDLKTRDVLELEENHNIHPTIPGHLLLIEVKNGVNNDGIIISNHRTIYFTKEYIHNMEYVLKEWILQVNDFKSIYLSLKAHKSSEIKMDRNFKQERRVRASPSYDVVFTTINPQPDKVKIVYDQEDAVKRYFQPLMSQLNLVADHKLKSQWLYLVELGQQPKKTGRGDFMLTSDQLPHIISPLEKKLGSGVSKNPCLHFIIYTSYCEEAPLYFRTHNGLFINAVLSPRWGGIQILNPEAEHCNGSRALVPDTSIFMSKFLTQLRALIGIASQEYSIPKASVLPLKSVKLRLWELDFLYRLTAVEQISLAQMTLQSLTQLLDEISNIVINEDVGGSVKTAVYHIEKGLEDLNIGNITGALYHARIAFDSSENAFTHPTLLALLYFPDDQKYAVYIPLFIPIMIPVLLSIRSIHSWKKIGFKSKIE